MSKGIEQMQVDFHNKAREILFSDFHAFQQAAEDVNRSTGEYRFQQLKQQYSATLQQHLQTAALHILEEYKDEEEASGASPVFYQLIKDYLHQFVQKANAL